ncbi:hemin-degrading factor [Pendulispora brunnea]|uniref:Hemin-degrading factor n=1 Tax=Pendulispora brunnea TaxID=2905690 RepID=A0ABZ2K5D7_9BACT
MNQNDLYERWLDLRASEKRLFALDAANKLNVTECELVASACTAPSGSSGPIAVRLEVPDWVAFVSALPKLGLVKAITRNQPAVIEVEGNYDRIEFFGAHGQSLGTIDLRIFLRVWRYAFFVREETSRGTSESLQIFDETGRAIHKIYLRAESDRTAFLELIETYRAKSSAALELAPPAQVRPVRPDAEIDVDGLRQAWLAMTDTHEFFGLLQRFSVARTQALRLAGSDLAYPVERDSLERILQSAAASGLSIMVFVGNAGIIQIYSGAITKVVPTGPWINVLDPTFNLHVQRDLIDSAWVVRKPTKDGNVTSLELYTREGEQIALLVGLRKPGQTENPAWRSAVEALPAALNQNVTSLT